jgi:hypothetical protein
VNDQASTIRAASNADYDLSTARPLRIGRGQIDSVNGRLADLRAYRRALKPAEIQQQAAAKPI